MSAAYLRLWLEHPRFQEELGVETTGVSVPHISGDQIGGFRLPLPTAERQREVVRRAQRGREAIARSHRAENKLRASLGEYRCSLIREAVTGKLDVSRMSDTQMDERLHAATEDRLDEVTA